LAPAIDAVQCRGPGGRPHGDAKVDVAQVAGWPGELQLVGASSQVLGGVQKLRAGGVAAPAETDSTWPSEASQWSATTTRRRSA
jgi:hypothetical protein